MARRSDNAQATVRRGKLYTLPNGKEVEIKSLGLTDYVQAREEALAQWKRERIKTWTANADLMPDDDRPGMLRDAFERAELLTIEDLPAKRMKMPVRNKDTGKLKRDKRGEAIIQIQRVEYSAWWMSETPEGRLCMTWLSIRRSDPDFTIEDADEIFKEAQDELERIADDIGEISGGDLGNSPKPPETEPEATETKRQRRKRRRRRRIGR